MYALRHAGHVNEDGQLVLADSSAWRRAVARHKGRTVWVTVVRQQRAHSLSQSKYYWGVVVRDIADFIGEGRDETHAYLKGMFLPKRSVEILEGQKLEMPGTTTTLSVEGYSEYIEKIRTWAASFLGLSIPDANQLEETL